MKFSEYTKSQQEAIVAKGSNIIVSAGAGSGKTQVLTERVVHFVRDENYQLKEFLILTFTNLAAGEMKNRIRKALKSEHLDAANDVDFADICTFDSYALSIVRKYHFMLHVSPNVSLVDSNIIDVRKRSIIENLFEEEYQKARPEFKSMIERFCFKDDDDLRKLLLYLYNKALLEIDTMDYIYNFVDHFYDPKTYQLYKDEMVNLFKEKRNSIFKLVNQLPNACILEKDERSVLKVYQNYLSSLAKAETYADFVVSLSAETPKTRLKKGYKEVGKIKQDANDAITDLQKYFAKLPQSNVEFNAYFESIEPFASLLIEMLIKLDTEIKAFKHKHQVFEFQDIAKMALTLVKENAEIREALKSSYKMIMIDEYQDTSLLQETFVSYIQNDNVYMVGDVKQSIYRFRNARCDIFVNKYRKYKAHDGGVAIDLNTNFRSRKEVLEDINYLFKQLMSEKYGEADYRHEHMIEYGNKKYLKAPNNQDNNHLDILYYKPHLSAETPDIEAEVIARDIISKINNQYPVMHIEKDKDGKEIISTRPCCLSDFCILMDRGGAFETYAKVFNEHKIPLHIENDENISDNDVVLVLTNILRLIKAVQENDYRSKDFIKAFLSVARSFLFEYSDDLLLTVCKSGDYFNDPLMIKLREIVNKFDYLSVSNLFEKVIYEFDVYHKSILVGNVAKVEKYLNTFLTMFKSMSELDYSINDFILFMECIDEYKLEITLSSSGSSVDSVQIMNIHKSKGLEFGIVYYSGLTKWFNRQDLEKDFNVSTRYGLVMPPLNPNDENILKTLNSNFEIEQDISEKIRLFYVALTRTKEKMICLIPSDEYHSFLRNLYLNKFNSYLDEKRIKDLDADEAFKIIYQDFVNQEIAPTLFRMLIKEIDFALPTEMRNLSLNELYQISLEQVFAWKLEEKEYLEKVNNFVTNLLEENKYPHLATLAAFNQYKENQIDLAFFYDVMWKLGTEIIDKEFYQQFNYDEEGNDITDREIVTLDIKNIAFDSEDEDNPFVERDCKYLSYTLELLELCENGFLTVPNLEKYTSLVDITLNQDVLDLLNKQEKIPNYLYNEYVIKDPIYEYNEKETTCEFLSIMKKAYVSKDIEENDIATCLDAYFGYFPYQQEVNLAITKLFNHQIDLETFKAALIYTGYQIKTETEAFLNDVIANKKSVDDVEQFINEDFYHHFLITSQTFDNFGIVETFPYESILKKLFAKYKENTITLERFVSLIDVFDFELTTEFSALEETGQIAFNIDDIDEIVVEKGVDFDDVLGIKSLIEFINPFVNYRKFNHRTIDLEAKAPVLNSVLEDKKVNKLTVNDVEIPYKVIDPYRPSKSITLGVDKKALDFGTKLHLAMEVTDFKNPDYSILEKELVFYIKRFIDSPLCKDIKSGEIYKEHEYYDINEDSEGVIDLFIVYDDHIDIIDYKTKHIDDASYDLQLSIYKKYVTAKFNKPVRTYLYSIIDGTYRETNL